MSKIERIYQGLNEIQKYYQDGVLQKLFFDWKHYIGTELNIEYGKECVGRNVVINGKTYQNLLKPINSTNWSGEGCEITDNYIKLIQSGYTEDIRTSCDLLKSGTKYTLVYNVKNHTLSSKAFVLKGGMEEKFIVNNNITLPIAIGLNRFTFTTSSTKANVSLFSLGISSGSLDGEYIELSDIILLEGDYTNTDLPTSITGIESVAEKENNILALKVNDVVSSVELPIPLRSLPNGVCDTIEGDKLVQRVGKVVLDGSLDEEWGTSSVIPQEETMIFQSTLIKETVKPNSCLLSNKFNQISDWNDTETIKMSGTNNVRLYIGINRNKLDTEDLKGFKKWLSENPVTVYYELATPIETEITPDKILINGEPITDTAGIELPNGTKDSIENGYYVKRIYKLSCYGAESWIKSDKWGGDSTSFFYLDTKKISGGYTMALTPTNTINCLCDLFTPIKTVDRTDFIKSGTEFICCSDGVTPLIMISISNSKLGSNNDVNEFKAYLQENPVTIWYELETAVKIPLFSIKEGLTVLKSTNNITPQMELDCLVRDDFQNLCDNVWEEDSSSSNNIVTKNFIDVSNGTYKRFYIENLNNFLYTKMGIYGYDKNGNKLVTWNSFLRNLIMPDLDIKKIKIFISGNDIEPKLYINHNTDKVLGEWESGAIDSSTGENTDGYIIRTKNYFQLSANTKYQIIRPKISIWLNIYIYDKDKNFIEEKKYLSTSPVLSVNEDIQYIRISWGRGFPEIPDIKIIKVE